MTSIIRWYSIDNAIYQHVTRTTRHPTYLKLISSLLKANQQISTQQNINQILQYAIRIQFGKTSYLLPPQTTNESMQLFAEYHYEENEAHRIVRCLAFQLYFPDIHSLLLYFSNKYFIFFSSFNFFFIQFFRYHLSTSHLFRHISKLQTYWMFYFLLISKLNDPW